MSIWKYVGAAAGGIGGLIVGGPAGAVAGASLGYGAGSSADASNESADAVSQANANAAGVKTPQLDPNAYGTQRSFLAGQMPTSQQTIGAQQQVNASYAQVQQLQTSIAQNQQLLAKKQAAGASPAELQLIQQQLDQNQAQLQQAQTRLAGAQKAYNDSNAADQGDSAHLAAQSTKFLGTAEDIAKNPQQGVQIDFGSAKPQEQAYDAASNVIGSDRGAVTGAMGAQKGFVDSLGQYHDTTGTNQQGLIKTLQGDLTDNSHSQAQLQLAAAQAQARNQEASEVASAGPQNYALATRTAMMNNATAEANAGNASAQLRATEYNNTLGQLGQATTAERGQTLQDIENVRAAQQAGLQTIGTQSLQAEQQDVAARAQDLQRLGMSYQNAVAQASQEAQQRQLNAQREQNYNNLGMQTIGAYQNSQQYGQNNQMRYTEGQATNALNAQGQKLGAQNVAIQTQQQDAASQRQMGAAMIGGGSSMIASGLQSGAFKGDSSGGGVNTQTQDYYNSNKKPDFGY